MTTNSGSTSNRKTCPKECGTKPKLSKHQYLNTKDIYECTHCYVRWQTPPNENRHEMVMEVRP